MIDMWDKKDNY